MFSDIEDFFAYLLMLCNAVFLWISANPFYPQAFGFSLIIFLKGRTVADHFTPKSLQAVYVE